MTGPVGGGRDRDGGARTDPVCDEPVCDEPGCDRRAAVRLHVPRAPERTVCPPHARVLARPDGVVAEPMDGAADEWP